MEKSEKRVPNPFYTGGADLTSGMTDELNLTAEINGQPVMLTPEPDGSIRVTPRTGGKPVSLSQGSEGAPSFEDLKSQWESLTGRSFPAPRDPHVPGGTADTLDLSDDEFIAEWAAWRAGEQIVDLALKVGDAVTFGGTGQAAGYGILQEIHTDEAKAVVNLCELTDDGALSPTAKKVVKNMGDLRPTDIPLVGTRPMGPEFAAAPSADLSASPSEGDPFADFSDDAMLAAVYAELDGTASRRRAERDAVERHRQEEEYHRAQWAQGIAPPRDFQYLFPELQR